MMKKIEKTIINLISDRGFLAPLSNEVPREFFLLEDMPVLVYLIEEALSIGSEKIVFLSNEKDKRFVSFFEKLKDLEEKLKEKGNKRSKVVMQLREKIEDVEFILESSLIEAVRGKEDFAFLESDKLIHSKKLPIRQVADIFKTSERPVLGLVESEKGTVETEKIARGLFKVKGFDKESNLSLFGRAIFTSESKKFFEEGKKIDEILESMIERGHTVYGTLISGKKLELNNYLSFQKAQLYYLLNSDNKSELKNFIKDNDLL